MTIAIVSLEELLNQGAIVDLKIERLSTAMHNASNDDELCVAERLRLDWSDLIEAKVEIDTKINWLN